MFGFRAGNEGVAKTLAAAGFKKKKKNSFSDLDGIKLSVGASLLL